MSADVQPSMPGDPSQLNVLARGGIASLAGVIANAVGNFGFFLFAARLLGPRESGALFEGVAALTICSYAAIFGADYGILRLMPKVRRESPGAELRLATAALAIPVLIGLVMCVGVLVSRPEISALIVRRGDRVATYHVLGTLAPFVPVGALLLVSTAGVRTWSIRGMVAIQNLMVPGLRLVALGLAGLLAPTPTVAALAWGLPMAAGAAAACTRVIRHYTPSIRLGARTVKSNVVRELWRFSAPRSLAGIFQIVVAWLDVLLVGAMASGKQAAAYAVASRYVVTGTFVLNAMGIAIAPQLSRLFDVGDDANAQACYRESTWWVMAGTWPVLSVLALFAPLMMAIFGPGYASGVSALEILAVAMLVNTGTGTNAIALLMAGGNTENLLIAGISLVINVGLNVLLIPHLAASGAALAWTVSILWTSMATALFLYRRTRLAPFGPGYVAVIIATLAGYGLVAMPIRLLVGSGVIGTVLGGLTGTVVFVAILLRLRSQLRLDDMRRLLLPAPRLPAS